MVTNPHVKLDLHADIDKYTSHPEVMGEGRVGFPQVPSAPTAAATVTDEDIHCDIGQRSVV